MREPDRLPRRDAAQDGAPAAGRKQCCDGGGIALLGSARDWHAPARSPTGGAPRSGRSSDQNGIRTGPWCGGMYRPGLVGRPVLRAVGVN